MRRAEAIERGVEPSDRQLRQQRVGIGGALQCVFRPFVIARFAPS